MELPNIEKASSEQVDFCKKLGIDVKGNTVGMAAAKLEELIQKCFWGIEQMETPTEKQIDLAKKFGIDISHMSRIVGNAVIDNIMAQLNYNAIKEQKLIPGLPVKKRNDPLNREFIISTIGPNGTVYFKGGNGQRAWARSLINNEKA